MNKSANYKLAKEYAKKHNIEQSTFDYLEVLDPTPNKKYLFQMLKWINEPYSINEHGIEGIISLIVDSIDLLAKLLPIFKIQIEQFKTIDDVLDFIEKHEFYTTKRENKVRITKDIDKIFENNNVIVIHLKSFESICLYGAGTRWCITQRDGSFYDTYKRSGKTFYYIFNKKEKPGSEFFKLAVMVNKAGEVIAFTPADEQLMGSKLDSFLEKNDIDKSIFTNRER